MFKKFLNVLFFENKYLDEVCWILKSILLNTILRSFGQTNYNQISYIWNCLLIWTIQKSKRIANRMPKIPKIPLFIILKVLSIACSRVMNCSWSDCASSEIESSAALVIVNISLELEWISNCIYVSKWNRYSKMPNLESINSCRLIILYFCNYIFFKLSISVAYIRIKYSSMYWLGFW